ncbi:MAG TPA: hypothetical protein VKU19_19460 [Bryobacteraceae bacterium]|nr:hypothetical protein [Bryobacteraceae bacterium]
MHSRIRLALPLLILVNVRGQPVRDPAEILERARANLQAMTHRLPNYACIETVERSYYEPPPQPGASCSLVPGAGSASSGPRKLEGTDRLRLEVTVSEGHEIHAWPGATRFDTRDVDEIIHQGPIGTGSFGTHLTGVFDNPAVQFQYVGEKADSAGTAIEYRYHVSAEASRYRVKMGSKWQIIPYDGTFWIDPESLDLRRFTVEAGQLPAASAMCSLNAGLDYQRVHIGDGDVLLPREGRLQIVMDRGKETTNVTTFSDCREYMTVSAVHFDTDSDANSAAAKPMVRTPVALPIGLPIYLALTGSIDTGVAAAGDPVSARVSRPVRRRGTNDVLIPAGALVLGRITRLERHILPQPYFLISLSFNRLVRGDVSSPFAARYDANAALARELGAEVHMGGRGLEFWDVGTFLFPSSKPTLVLPAGYESQWETLATPSR